MRYAAYKIVENGQVEVQFYATEAQVLYYAPREGTTACLISEFVFLFPEFSFILN
jgi:hypothetical protein